MCLNVEIVTWHIMMFISNMHLWMLNLAEAVISRFHFTQSIETFRESESLMFKIPFSTIEPVVLTMMKCNIYEPVLYCLYSIPIQTRGVQFSWIESVLYAVIKAYRRMKMHTLMKLEGTKLLFGLVTVIAWWIIVHFLQGTWLEEML